jgi:hypothetical protein|nr:hypothetical protein [Kofleriaceae bacterium]
MARRARLALIACALWLAGFEVLPWMHVAMHDELAPHVHAADGTIIRVSFTETTHRHADGSVHRDRDDQPAGSPPRKHRHRTPFGYSLDHGAGSFAHHGVAVVPAAPPVTHPLPVDRRAQLVAVAAMASVVSCSIPVASARGPPPARA